MPQMKGEMMMLRKKTKQGGKDETKFEATTRKTNGVDKKTQNSNIFLNDILKIKVHVIQNFHAMCIPHF